MMTVDPAVSGPTVDVFLPHESHITGQRLCASAAITLNSCVHHADGMRTPHAGKSRHVVVVVVVEVVVVLLLLLVVVVLDLYVVVVVVVVVVSSSRENRNKISSMRDKTNSACFALVK